MPATSLSSLDPSGTLDLRPLTARSVLLSVMLGTHPPRLAVRTLIGVAALFDIAEGTVRVALSRMAADGEVHADGGHYQLSSRLVARQIRQDEGRNPPLRHWTGQWEMAVISPGQRADIDRGALGELRLAELIPGVWVRPANLDRRWPETVCVGMRRFEARPDGDPVAMTHDLWDLDGWARRADGLGAALDATSEPAGRFTISAALLRHLRRDPLLPAELLPVGWPGNSLRARYRAFEAEFEALLSSRLPSRAPASSDQT